MAQIGCLGDIVFLVSSKKVETIDKAVWSGSARYGTHQRVASDTLTEFTGTDPDAFSFDLVLSSYFGTDPSSEISRLVSYERNGQTVPLVIGDRTYGRYRWTIEKHNIKMEVYDKHGKLFSATVSVDLLEYLRS